MSNLLSDAGLAARLKRETSSLHHWVERSPLMAALVHGTIDRPSYCRLLVNLHALYAALEDNLARNAAHFSARPGAEHLWGSPLRRLPALASDLDHLMPGGWHQPTLITAATQDYVDHLHALGRERPLLLLAHAYLRYLGDLHGGQMLARSVRAALALPSAAGTAFYDFGPAARVETLRQQFRAGLDALALTRSEADAFVAEACAAFERHGALFEALTEHRAAEGQS